ncbi:MAG: alpha/beta hydrolase [Ilumatobacter sp.]|uniref:alpha/beta fold hydrolase n=1 Tax=Ilumatobacter sp. TaxID=1967498 RepID=UPI00261115A1|nr:alpha/beta hydrolase [Ilumatobacter sp.]MDJ0768669.1 alpha/beta hydrolase [Ilumatobacter sp.]
MASVQANGITIEFEEQGTGEPILLVMGLGAQLIDWPQGLVDLIAAEGFRVIRFDNRDSGLSSEFTSEPPTTAQLAKAVLLRRLLQAEYLLSDMADDAVGLLGALGIDSAHVVGASMGGMIAQAMAIEHPARVRSMTSIMSTTGNRRVGQPTLRLIQKTVRRPVPTRETAADIGVEAFRDICGPTFDEDEFRALVQTAVDRSFRPAGTARQTAAIIASGDRTAGLERLDVPALVIHGMLDELVRPSGGLATARAIPGSRLLMFNDMAHDLPHTRWREMADAIAHNAQRAGRPLSAVV